jgi:DNA-binding NtrC family response regulator
MADAGSFRADLYYRLNVLPIRLPPLRERLEDLPVLCEALLEQIAEKAGEPVKSVSTAGLARLAAYHWPGNVRELGNILQLAAARHDVRLLGSEHFDDLPVTAPVVASAAATNGEVRALRDAVAAAEKAEIIKALAAAHGVKLNAAKLLSISRAQLYEKLAAHGLLSETPDRKEAV